jgi:ADP-dependent NAD(P)H-hydrate dehydratase / NAD(P)H-hydrate epimerase
VKGLKVVTAKEMARIEKQAYAAGCSEKEFMENAGKALAEATSEYALTNSPLEKKITLLAGKGNNGGDSYVAGRYLLAKGFEVTAYHPYSLQECSPLCREAAETFKKSGGVIHPHPELRGILLDGLVGTGFKGKAEGILAKAIAQANHSQLDILAIDIPSGLDANTGKVGSVAINAKLTITLGLPKIGFFIGKGWDHLGELCIVDFGLPLKFVEKAKAEAYLVDEDAMVSLLPPIKRSRHKYEAGYVLAIAGSLGMTGAALLSSFAALCAGSGIVRLFYPRVLRPDMIKAPLELLTEPWDLHPKRILEEESRARSLLIGPGLGRKTNVVNMLKKLLPMLSKPMVLDADALFFLSKNPRQKLPEEVVLTPHKEEMKRLLGGEEVSFAACQSYAEEKNVTVILKGAPTVIFHPKTPPLIIPRGDPGMATAGTGDVLTGFVASFLSQGLTCYHASVLGVYLHALAGELAAAEKTSYCLIASDLIAYLPDAFQRLRS